MATKLLTSFAKVNESFTVYRYENGFMVEAGGRNEDGDYKNKKILCNTRAEVDGLITEILALPLDD